MKARIALAIFSLLAMAAFAEATPDQPFMRAARADLGTAKRELQKATPDKAGHRVKAIALVNQAIAEVDAGIAWDRRHNHVSSMSVANLFAANPDQPHMEAAKTALESAKNNLEHATADKGGHRGRAIDIIKDAISEVKKGIDAAR